MEKIENIDSYTTIESDADGVFIITHTFRLLECTEPEITQMVLTIDDIEKIKRLYEEGKI